MTSNFGENLMELRKQKGLSRKDFAEKMKLPVTTIAGYETAGREPKFKTLIRLADYFGVSIDDLIRPKGEIKPRDEETKIVFLNDGKRKIIDVTDDDKEYLLWMMAEHLLLKKTFENLGIKPDKPPNFAFADLLNNIFEK